MIDELNNSLKQLSRLKTHLNIALLDLSEDKLTDDIIAVYDEVDKIALGVRNTIHLLKDEPIETESKIYGLFKPIQ